VGEKTRDNGRTLFKKGTGHWRGKKGAGTLTGFVTNRKRKEEKKD